MAFEPVALFFTKGEARDVIARLRMRKAKLELDGTDEAWTRANVEVPLGWLRGSSHYALTHVSAYYDTPDAWSAQRAGMMAYVAGFRDPMRIGLANQAIASAVFALGISTESFDVHADSPTRKDVFDLCRHFDGFAFTPTSIFDAHGKVFMSTTVPPDADAKLPRTRTFTPASRIEPRNVREGLRYQHWYPMFAEGAALPADAALAAQLRDSRPSVAPRVN